MWAFYREEGARQQQEQQHESVLAREQAMSVLRQRGISPPSNHGPPVTVTASPAPLEAAPNPIPKMYREWITPAIANRLTASDIWFLQQNEKNLQTAQQGKAWRQQVADTARPKPMAFQLVPASTLVSDEPPQNRAPDLRLTSQVESQIKPATTDTGKP